jgi:hypothetical protein
MKRRREKGGMCKKRKKRERKRKKGKRESGKWKVKD